MKRLITCIALVTMAACGGDSSTSPKQPTFPAVVGVYNLSGAFNGGGLPFSGTITFSQASREQPTLDGLCAVSVQTSTGPITFSTIAAASVSEAGAIGFNIGPATGTTTWRFTGVVSGSSITGTHTLAGSSGTFVGTFNATKQ
jgi:hypothetical protein